MDAVFTEKLKTNTDLHDHTGDNIFEGLLKLRQTSCSISHVNQGKPQKKVLLYWTVNKGLKPPPTPRLCGQKNGYKF